MQLIKNNYNGLMVNLISAEFITVIILIGSSNKNNKGLSFIYNECLSFSVIIGIKGI